MTVAATIRDPSRRRPARSMASVVLLAALCLSPGGAKADIDFDGLFSSGAVLQRGVRVPIFGTGDDGDEVVLTLQGQTATTTVASGRWRVEFSPLEAGGPFAITVGGTNEFNVKNVYVGDVWVCAGESNMQSAVQSADGGSSAVLSPKNRRLHYFNVKREGSAEPRRENQVKWTEAGATSTSSFSAIGYFFGREIQATTDVPIGLISCNHFSSSAETWTSTESMLTDPALKSLVEDAPPRVDWQTPGKLFNGMVLPIADFPVKGVICYHGESNVDRAADYRALFSLLIADWRKAWKQPDLPFLFVQLTGFKPVGTKPKESRYADLRQAQFEVWKSTPNTAMIVSTDFGDAYSQIPKAKEPIAKRLSFAARALVYGEKIEYMGPVLKSATVNKEWATLTFDHIADGLDTKGKSKLQGFTIAGADEEYFPAESEIVGNGVVLRHAEVPAPKFVRYNWADFPTGNLFNKDGYPAAPFRAPLTLGEAGKLASDGHPLANEWVQFDGKKFQLNDERMGDSDRAKEYVPEGQIEKTSPEVVGIIEFWGGDDYRVVADGYLATFKKDPKTQSLEMTENEAKTETLIDYVRRSERSMLVEYVLMKLAKRGEKEFVLQMYTRRATEAEAAKALLDGLPELRKRLREKMTTEGVTPADAAPAAGGTPKS